MKRLFLITTSLFLLSCNSNNNIKVSDREDAPMLLSNASHTSSCVYLTKDEKENPLISWCEMDSTGKKYFYFANWDSASQKFGTAIPIPMQQTATIHDEGMPKIAVKGDGTIMAIYETNVPSEKSKYGFSDIQFVMSPDKGKTWTSPQSIQNKNDVSSISYGGITRLDDGEIGLCWLGTNKGDQMNGRPVLFAKTNGNEGFGDAIVIDQFACECCRTALSSDGSGNVTIAYRDILPGSVRDISLCTSHDNGQTFGKTLPFSNDHWVINGCPDNGPSIVSDNKNTFVTWFTGGAKKGVFYAALDKNNQMQVKKQLASDGRFIQLCLMPDGARLAAFNTSYQIKNTFYSKIVLTKINDKGYFEKEISLPGTHASLPVILSSGNQEVIVAWSDDGKIYYRPVNTESVTEVPTENPVKQFSLNEEMPVMHSHMSDGK